MAVSSDVKQKRSLEDHSDRQIAEGQFKLIRSNNEYLKSIKEDVAFFANLTKIAVGILGLFLLVLIAIEIYDKF